MLPAESASVCDGNEATKVRSDSLTSLTTPRTRSEVEKRRKEEQVSKQPNKQTIKPNLRRPCQCLNTSVPPDLSLLLPDHQLAQQVASTEDLLETDLQLSLSSLHDIARTDYYVELLTLSGSHRPGLKT